MLTEYDKIQQAAERREAATGAARAFAVENPVQPGGEPSRERLAYAAEKREATIRASYETAGDALPHECADPTYDADGPAFRNTRDLPQPCGLHDCVRTSCAGEGSC